MSPQSDQLTPEDLKALSDVHDHLVSAGDSRAPKVKAYLGTQNMADIDPSVLAAREHYRQTFHQEPPDGYPHHLPGTGMDELSGMGLGTGLAAAPVTTGLSLLTSGIGQKAAEAMGAGPGVSAGVGMGLGALTGAGVGGARALMRAPNSTGELPELSGLTRFGLKLVPGGRTGLKAYDALSDIVNKSSEPWTPAPIAPLKPNRFSPSAQQAPEFTPAPDASTLNYPGRGSVNITPGAWPQGVSKPQFSTPTPQPLPAIPPVSWHGQAPEPQLPAIPPVKWNTPQAIESAPSLTGVNTPKGEPMPDLTAWSKANAALHANTQQMAVPGSPAGVRLGSGLISQAAKDVFGKPYQKLTADQIDSITGFFVKNERLPTAVDKHLFK